MISTLIIVVLSIILSHLEISMLTLLKIKQTSNINDNNNFIDLE
jgi:hypothetical protein